MAKAGLTIAISGTYNGRALEKAREDLEKMRVTAVGSLGEAGSGLVKFGGNVADLGGEIHNAGYKMEETGKKASVVTAALGAVGAASFSTAADFESSMSRVAGALDDPNANMEELRALALKTGEDTIFGATEAGNAMEELAKGGLTSADIQGGALASTMSLAAAGGLDLATSANTIVQAMGAFGLSAGQTSEAANALAGSAAASSADVSDLSQGLAQASAQAHSAGWSIQDTTAVLGAFADAGIVGSDAGTSLKTMLQRLAAPTDKAATLMDSLGINVRDSNGNMLDAQGVAQELQDKLGGLSSAEKDAAMQTLFGSDASRAALIMTNLGREGLEKYVQATNDQTAAQRMADSQMGKSQNAIEQMNGAIETASIQVGQALAPAVIKVAGLVGDAASSFSSLDSDTQQMIVDLGLAAAAFGPVTTVGGKFLQGIGNVVTGIGSASQKLGVLKSDLSTVHEAFQLVRGGAGTAAEGFEMVKTSTGLVTGAMGLLKTALVGLGIGAAVVAVGTIVSALKDWYDHERAVEGATTDLETAMGSAQEAYDSYAQATGVAVEGTESVAKSLGDVKQQAEDAMKGQADLAVSMSDQWADYGTNAAMVDAYAKQIEDLTSKYDEQGNKIQLTANEQAALKMAVDGFNEATGASIEVIDAQNGQLSTSTDVIKANAEAFKEQARAQAAMEMYKDLYKQQITDEMALNDATATLNDLKAKEAEAWGTTANGVNPYTSQVYEAQKTVNELTSSLESNKNTQDQLLGVISGSTTAFQSFDDALANTGTSLSDFGELTDAQLQALQDGFDGSLSSIVRTCNEQGIQIPQSLADGINANSVAANDASYGIGEDVTAGISKGIEDTKDDVQSPITSFVDGVIGWFKNLFGIHSPSTVMAEIGADVDRGLSQGIADNQTDPVTAIQTLAQGVLDGIQNLPNDLQNLGADAGQLLSDGISGAKDLARQAGEALFNSGKDGANPLTEALGTIGTNAGQWLTEHLGGFAGNARNAGQSLFTNAQDGANPLKESLKNIGQTAGSNLTSMVESFRDKSRSAGTSLYDAGKTGANPLIEALRSIGSDAGSKLVSMLSSFVGQARNAAESLNDSARDGLDPVKGEFGSIGSEAANDFASVIGGSSAYGEGSNLADSARNGLGSVSASTTGWNFVVGFINGMQGVNLWSYAYNIGRSALDAIKSALGIASPSKEAAKVGAFFGQGAVIGMDSTIGEIEAEASKMSAAMSLSPEYGSLNVLDGGRAYTSSYQASRAQGQTFTFNVTVNVSGSVTQQSAQEVGQTIGQQLYEEFRRRERNVA